MHMSSVTVASGKRKGGEGRGGEGRGGEGKLDSTQNITKTVHAYSFYYPLATLSDSPSSSFLLLRTVFSVTLIVRAKPPLTVRLSLTMKEPGSMRRT